MDLKRLLLEENVGGFDLALRALLGTIAIIVLAMDLVASSLRWLVALIAFVGLYTSIMRHCSPYVLIGFSTKDGRDHNKKP